jgi:hypothetical protein
VKAFRGRAKSVHGRLVRYLTATMVAFAVATATALADEQVASSGQVTATFTFERHGEYKFTDLWLTIDRAGTKVFDAAVDIPACQEPYCVPEGVFRDSDTVHVRDLDADGEPEVLVDVFTGGAHCCSATEILRFDGTSYRASSRNWADAGYRLADLDDDGRPEFRTSDTRFAYAFASFADSAFPIRVLAWSNGQFANVTRQHAALIRKDAKRWKRLYHGRRHGNRSLGVLAAWTADQYLLGRRTQANRFLAREQRAGRLRSSAGWKSGTAFVRQLKRRLRRWAY